MAEYSIYVCDCGGDAFALSESGFVVCRVCESINAGIKVSYPWDVPKAEPNSASVSVLGACVGASTSNDIFSGVGPIVAGKDRFPLKANLPVTD